MAPDRDERPTPEQMLARARVEEIAAHRGRLRVYFGYAAGVGKTFAMLEAAQAHRRAGAEIVVGYVEPHGRVGTEALLDGLEALPPLEVRYRGATLREFDLDAALERRPRIVLVDELAHTNAAGLRHPKRWQDVQELLELGIDVWTTLNVQHIESLNDVVSQITGVVVRETVPDDVFLQADEVELVDITPEELLQRLHDGKVYLPAQAERALRSFFQKGNLTALRELSLRRTADRVNVDVQSARLGAAARQPWPTAERLLVCVGPSPSSAKVVRAARRLADTLHAPWLAVHVETPQAEQASAANRQSLKHNLRLAERLGAEVVSLSGDDVVTTVLDYANERNVTKMVLGKPYASHRPWWRLRRGTLVDKLLRNSSNVDMYVVRGVDEPSRPEVATPSPRADGKSPWPWTPIAVVLAASTLVAWGFHRLGLSDANLVMAYLLGVVWIATRYGRWPSIVVSLVGVLLFDVLFTQPYFSVTVYHTQYLVTFAVMLVVGLVASTLAARVRYQAETAHRNERRTEALYRLARQLAGLSGMRQLLETAEHSLSEVFDGNAVIFLPDDRGHIGPIVGHAASFAASASEFAAAQWVLDRGQIAGLGTDTLPSSLALYLPLVTLHGPLGVLAVQPNDPHSLDAPEARSLLATFATQIAFALERERLSEATRKAQLQMETERLRSSLLSSVSHDLRTPLSAIAGAGSSLLESLPATDDTQVRRELLETIVDEANRLARLVENLLSVTRLESGAVKVSKEWHVLEDVVGSAIRHVGKRLAGHALSVEIPADVPMTPLDSVLIEQVLVNLLENAARYSAADTPITVTARKQVDGVVIEVADRGVGLAAGEEERIFEKFYRGEPARTSSRGAGLGLSICRAIVQAHGGRIWASNRPDGGTSFFFSLPVVESPPSVPAEVDEESAAKKSAIL